MTRRPAPDRRPVALTIAGSDSGGGAGIQADLKTMEASDVFGTSVVTSVTAQHTTGVESTHVLPTAEVEAQLSAVLSDFDVKAAKTGMLATAEIVESVAERLAGVDVPIVVDPVMVATSGDRLLERAAERAYEDLFAEAAVVTPNADEAAVLTDIEPTDEASMIDAGEQLLEMGADAALLKGGHVPGETVVDILVTPDSTTTYSHPRIDPAATHGSGCTLASAIAARLAHGDSLDDAVERGIGLLQRAIRYYSDVGEAGAVHHAVEQRERAERTETARELEMVLSSLRRLDAGEETDVTGIVPEVGLQLVAATPYAEQTDEIAAVDGRLTRTGGGVRPNRGVRFGASSHVASVLLAAREFDPELRFAAACRYDETIETALDELGWRVAVIDRTDDSDEDARIERANDYRQQNLDGAFDRIDGTPDAVVEKGAVGTEPMTCVFATDADELTGKLEQLATARR